MTKVQLSSCSKSWSRDLVDAELDALVAAFKAKGIARVSYQRSMACVSLICNVQRTSEILERVRPPPSLCIIDGGLDAALVSIVLEYLAIPPQSRLSSVVPAPFHLACPQLHARVKQDQV